MKTTDANSGNTPELTNEQYFEERKLLLAARQRGYQRADQMIVGGATGALVLSITFLRNLGSAAGLLASGWLVFAWFLLLVTLLVNLLSNYTSAKSFDVEVKPVTTDSAHLSAVCERRSTDHARPRAGILTQTMGEGVSTINLQKPRIASTPQARQRLRRPSLRSGPPGDPPGPFRLRGT